MPPILLTFNGVLKMSCIYSDYNGKCKLFQNDYNGEDMGFTNEGICVVEDDPDPGLSCVAFESLDDKDEDE